MSQSWEWPNSPKSDIVQRHRLQLRSRTRGWPHVSRPCTREKHGVGCCRSSWSRAGEHRSASQDHELLHDSYTLEVAMVQRWPPGRNTQCWLQYQDAASSVNWCWNDELISSSWNSADLCRTCDSRFLVDSLAGSGWLWEIHQPGILQSEWVQCQAHTRHHPPTSWMKKPAINAKTCEYHLKLEAVLCFGKFAPTNHVSSTQIINAEPQKPYAEIRCLAVQQELYSTQLSG